MTGTLALVGGGAFTEGCAFDRDLLAEAASTEVLLLTTAAAFENPMKVAGRATDWFAALGATVQVLNVVHRTEAVDASVAARMRAAGFVYLPGSSPLHLRSVLHESALWEALVAAWEDGATIVAAGEAASGLADPMLDPRGGAFGLGLGLVKGMAMLPHAEQDGIDLVEHHRRTLELAPKGLPLATVPDCTALVRAGDGTWSSTGTGTARVYVDGKERGFDALP